MERTPGQAFSTRKIRFSRRDGSDLEQTLPKISSTRNRKDTKYTPENVVLGYRSDLRKNNNKACPAQVEWRNKKWELDQATKEVRRERQ